MISGRDGKEGTTDQWLTIDELFVVLVVRVKRDVDGSQSLEVAEEA
jgi:hypothetical protein